MKWIEASGRGAQRAERLLRTLERRGASGLDRVRPRVERIVDCVRRGGDRALKAYSVKLDGISKQQPLRIPAEVLRAAWREAPMSTRNALEAAAANIADFAYRQMPEEWDLHPRSGVTVGQRVRPLGSVGCYVPERAASAAFDPADGRGAGACGGRTADCRCFTSAGA